MSKKMTTLILTLSPSKYLLAIIPSTWDVWKDISKEERRMSQTLLISVALKN